MTRDEFDLKAELKMEQERLEDARQNVLGAERDRDALYHMLRDVVADAGDCDLSFPGRCIRHGGRLPCVFAHAAQLLARLERPR